LPHGFPPAPALVPARLFPPEPALFPAQLSHLPPGPVAIEHSRRVRYVQIQLRENVGREPATGPPSTPRCPHPNHAPDIRRAEGPWEDVEFVGRVWGSTLLRQIFSELEEEPWQLGEI
jgi:hypothetical protein